MTRKALNSIVITVAKISPKLSWIRQNTGLKLQMKMKTFNFDQCGKNFAIGCNLNDHEIDSWIELWTSPFLDLKLKKRHIQIVHDSVLIFFEENKNFVMIYNLSRL